MEAKCCNLDNRLARTASQSLRHAVIWQSTSTLRVRSPLVYPGTRPPMDAVVDQRQDFKLILAREQGLFSTEFLLRPKVFKSGRNPLCVWRVHRLLQGGGTQ